MIPAEAIAKARARLAFEMPHDEVLRVLLGEIEMLKSDAAASRHGGRMEALNAVFQINGPSRAIARLKKQYAADHPHCAICGGDHQSILCPVRLGAGKEKG